MVPRNPLETPFLGLCHQAGPVQIIRPVLISAGEAARVSHVNGMPLLSLRPLQAWPLL